VKLEPGLQVLKIFKDHVCKTSILDDFGFYDNREKMMQERKAKQQQPLKKVWRSLLWLAAYQQMCIPENCQKHFRAQAHVP
jgi:ribosomal protein S21